MKPLIILMLFIVALQLPNLASAQDQKVPIKTSDGAIAPLKQEVVPIKPGSGAPAAMPQTFAASQAQQSGKPVSMVPADKSQTVVTPAATGKITNTTSTLPTQQLFKPVVNDNRPPIIEQQGPANSNRPFITPQPAKQ
ncbi:MAG: hypothetical protein JO154_15190 [Chitinophaga sp.]|uniref:hypothetical protein n=1 Tax=Chitinophaga sp. TaxID=1869181 RepID=UPI0025C440B6|nr:hypothetical protein [Chitinophaga sp.]MBV8253947.1 hypothetical protein [Chitinophaga sp.]